MSKHEFFAGEAFLTPTNLDKHDSPFYSEVHVGLMTLNKLKIQANTFKHVVAGHGKV